MGASGTSETVRHVVKEHVTGCHDSHTEEEMRGEFLLLAPLSYACLVIQLSLE